VPKTKFTELKEETQDVLCESQVYLSITANVQGLPPAVSFNTLSNLMQQRLAASQC
jgi:hypothetical protein